jgi:hypothetical protein
MMFNLFRDAVIRDSAEPDMDNGVTALKIASLYARVDQMLLSYFSKVPRS